MAKSVTIVNSILGNTPPAEVKSALTTLAESLGAELFDRLVPERVNDISTLQTILDMSRKLRALEGCVGFRNHVSQYKTDSTASYFVTCLAYHLLPVVDSLTLEPEIPGGHKSDILALLENQEVYIECKHPFSHRRADLFREHQRICGILLKYITVPHQVTLRYRETPSDEAVERLGTRLQAILESVTGNGTVLQSDGITVSVVTREAYGFRGFRAVIPGVSTDLYSRADDPCHVFFEEGKTVEICGPRFDEAATIARLVKKSRVQSPRGKPYVLAISTNGMLGELAEQVSSVRNAFQPRKNTRFSGVLLAGFPREIDETTAEFVEVPKLIWIPNPFAQYSLNDFAMRAFGTRHSRGEP